MVRQQYIFLMHASSLLCLVPCRAWISQGARALHRHAATSSTDLRMGLFDFLKNRENDFIKLHATDEEFGPGPLLIMYYCPSGIDDEEVQDMFHDNAPTAQQKSCRIHRIQSPLQPELDLSVRDATTQIANGALSVTSTEATVIQSNIPVLLFSGFRRQEMMAVYNILGKEIYDETGGLASPACAMVVPNAMEKPLRQVFEEISGDHSNAMELAE